MNKNMSLNQLTFMAICIAMSLVAKRAVSPLTNGLTDLIRIPGGGAAAAFSIMFLLLGTSGINWRWAASSAAFIQSLIALSLGMSSYQGLFAVLTYTLPGFVIDIFRSLFTQRDKLFFSSACAAANAAGALLSNILVFRLEGIAFFLWILVACSFGVFGGLIGEMLFKRLIRIPEYRRLAVCQRN